MERSTRGETLLSSPFFHKHSSRKRSNEMQINSKSNNNSKFLRATLSLRSFLLLIPLLLLLSLASLIDPLIRVAEGSEEMAPRITIQPNDLIVTEGESSEMNCDAEGWPAPTIEWFHNGQNITSKTRSRTTLGGSIMFLDAKPPASSGWQSDTGNYHCEARNSLGRATSRNASLQVACKQSIIWHFFS